MIGLGLSRTKLQQSHQRFKIQHKQPYIHICMYVYSFVKDFNN